MINYRNNDNNFLALILTKISTKAEFRILFMQVRDDAKLRIGTINPTWDCDISEITTEIQAIKHHEHAVQQLGKTEKYDM